MTISFGGGTSEGGFLVPSASPFNTTTDRDNWATANPSLLIPNVTLVQVTTPAEWYLWNGASWIVATPIVQGPSGEDGTPLHGVDNLGQDELITINADTTKFDVKPFYYWIDDVRYYYAGQTGISAGFTAGDDFLLVGVDASGLFLHPKDTFFTPTDLQTKLEIGGMATADGSNIVIIGNSYFRAEEVIRNLAVWSQFSKRTNFLGTAGSISESVNALQIDVAAGDIIDPDLHLHQITGESDIGMVAYYRVAGDYELQPKVTPFVVDNLQYDDGTNLATLSNNKWASHTIARSSRTGTYYFIYSDGQYDNEAEAIDAPFTLGGFGTTLGNQVEPLAKIVIQKSSSNINQIIDIRNETSTVISASTSTMQTTYDRSVNPLITLSAGKVIDYRNAAGDSESTLQSWSDNTGSAEYASVGTSGVVTTGLSTGIKTVTVSTLLADSDHTVLSDATSGNITLTLPAASTVSGSVYVIKKIDGTGNTVTIDANSTETIDGSLTAVISDPNVSLTIQSDGSNWFII